MSFSSRHSNGVGMGLSMKRYSMLLIYFFIFYFWFAIVHHHKGNRIWILLAVYTAFYKCSPGSWSIRPLKINIFCPEAQEPHVGTVQDIFWKLKMLGCTLMHIHWNCLGGCPPNQGLHHTPYPFQTAKFLRLLPAHSFDQCVCVCVFSHKVM